MGFGGYPPPPLLLLELLRHSSVCCSLARGRGSGSRSGVGCSRRGTLRVRGSGRPPAGSTPPSPRLWRLLPNRGPAHARVLFGGDLD